MATLSIDDPLPDEEDLGDRRLIQFLPDIENIKPMLLTMRKEDRDKCEVTFKTFPVAQDGTLDRLSFLLGSCRYPGLLWKIKEADGIFAPMQAQLIPLNDPASASFTLMVGDQIYADTLNRFVPVGLADTYEEFQERYQTAFGSLNMRNLLRSAPTYMILDDHEVEDNWTQDRIRKDAKHRLFNLAIGAYLSYQWSHGPRCFDGQLYYNFDCGGYPFFVLDTRTQRYKDDEVGLDDNHMLGRPTIDTAFPGQLKRFLDWLSKPYDNAPANAPKFVVSSSVFAPNAMNERVTGPVGPGQDPAFWANRARREDSDSWPAYPNTRKAIIEHIVQNNIQNVVFLTGDIHCSNIARLIFKMNGQDVDIRAYDVTSSAFYWPFPFADGDPNDFVHNSTAESQYDPFPFGEGKGVMDYWAWGFTQKDNYARIDIDRAQHRLVVSYFDRDGNPVKVLNAEGVEATENYLTLAPW
jgi:alkaline phosphatase D